MEKRRKLRRAALKKTPLTESERVQGGDSFSLADYLIGRAWCGTRRHFSLPSAGGVK